jgi:uncharacterized GH25 family protein
MRRLHGLHSKSLAVALALLAGSASAHDTWIVPDKPQVAPGETISLNLTSGMAFPALGSGPSPAGGLHEASQDVRRCGEPGQDSSWKQPVGTAFEIVPEQDPTALSSGDRLTVRLMKDGKPVREFPVGLVAGGTNTGALQKTDAQGRVSFQLDRAGWWLLRATHIERSAKQDLEWESRFTTLTVLVR